MIRLNSYIGSLPPQTVASNGTNGFLVVDTRPTTGERYEAIQFVSIVGPGAATTAPTTWALSESADTNATSYSTVSGFVGGTNAAGGFTIASIATSAGSGATAVFNVNLRNTRKRYLKVSIVPGTTAQVTIVAIASQPSKNIAPNTTGSGGTYNLYG